jgi:hypothetical protein
MLFETYVLKTGTLEMSSGNKLLLILEMDNMAKYAVSAGLARAVADHTELELKRNAGLKGVAGFCAFVSGGTMEVNQNWAEIERARKMYSERYMGYMLEAAAQGPLALQRYCQQLENVRNNEISRVNKLFHQAAQHNESFVNRTEWGFEISRAVKITALGTLALLGAVGSLAGVGGATAYGVAIEGFGFAKGLLVVLGTKTAYAGATNWMLSTDDVKAVAIKTGEHTAKEARNNLLQTAAERTVGMAFYAKLKAWSQQLAQGQQYQTLVEKANKNLQNQQSKGNSKQIEQAERRVARKTNVVERHSGKMTTARWGRGIVQNGLPVLWLGLDLKGVWDEANADAQLLH